MTDTEQEGLRQARVLYSTYPRHVAPAAALKAITKAVKKLVESKELPNEYEARRWLWKKVKAYALSPAGQKPPKGCDDFRPHPATWFNRESYFDDPIEWQKPNGVSRNGSNHRTESKASRTLEAIQNVLHARTGAHLYGLGPNGNFPGSGAERDLPRYDDGAVVEGKR